MVYGLVTALSSWESMKNVLLIKYLFFVCSWIINNYYIDASVLLENNHWHISHILTSEDIDDVIYRFLH